MGSDNTVTYCDGLGPPAQYNAAAWIRQDLRLQGWYRHVEHWKIRPYPALDFVFFHVPQRSNVSEFVDPGIVQAGSAAVSSVRRLSIVS